MKVKKTCLISHTQLTEIASFIYPFFFFFFFSSERHNHTRLSKRYTCFLMTMHLVFFLLNKVKVSYSLVAQGVRVHVLFHSI